MRKFKRFACSNDECSGKEELTVGAFTANSGSQVQFRAGSSIVLQPGFQARVGSEFRARIDDCLVVDHGYPLSAQRISALATTLPSTLALQS